MKTVPHQRLLLINPLIGFGVNNIDRNSIGPQDANCFGDTLVAQSKVSRLPGDDLRLINRTAAQFQQTADTIVIHASAGRFDFPFDLLGSQ